MARASKDQLVSEYLENIHGDVLKNFPQLVRAYIKGKHGVYALYRKSKLYYVGLASNLGRRLKHHLKDRHSGHWDRFSIYMTNDQQHMKDLESLFLRIAKPTGNKIKGKFARATLLNRKFKRDIVRRMMGDASVLVGGKETAPQGIPKQPRKLRKGREPVLAPYVNKRFMLRMDHKGKIIKAWVWSNGTVNWNGKLFNSPSTAAARARRKKACNGWKVWKFKNSAGEWVYLDELRKKPKGKAVSR